MASDTLGTLIIGFLVLAHTTVNPGSSKRIYDYLLDQNTVCPVFMILDDLRRVSYEP